MVVVVVLLVLPGLGPRPLSKERWIFVEIRNQAILTCYRWTFRWVGFGEMCRNFLNIWKTQALIRNHESSIKNTVELLNHVHMGVSKNRVPQHGWFIMENPIKMDDLGVPLFLETPICSSIFHLNTVIRQTYFSLKKLFRFDRPLELRCFCLAIPNRHLDDIGVLCLKW